jgi:Protein of unknown function (DUF2938)
MTTTSRPSEQRNGEAPSVRDAALSGVLATVAMGVGALGVFASVFGTRCLGARNLGRWIGHMREARFTHDDIAAASPIAHEAAIGVAAHYATGLTVGAVHGLLLRGSWCSRPAASGRWESAAAAFGCPRSRSAIAPCSD